MTENEKKPNLFEKLIQQKMEKQKSGVKKPDNFGRFKTKKQRNENNSNVGPSWGGRKGN